jgi:hypothetical protein
MLSNRIFQCQCEHIFAKVTLHIIRTIQTISQSIDEAIIKTNALHVLNEFDLVLDGSVEVIHVLLRFSENKKFDVANFGGNCIKLLCRHASAIDPESDGAVFRARNEIRLHLPARVIIHARTLVDEHQIREQFENDVRPAFIIKGRDNELLDVFAFVIIDLNIECVFQGFSGVSLNWQRLLWPAHTYCIARRVQALPEILDKATLRAQD